ncbi:type II toxin-antitoxin system RelE/ParE family toxin [Candidatus Woesearchaeota archaeon]|nr:type II toxin-antitoxin system RelE/ParE family toxin [Candidatus Woesearchaeota archaeon]
MNLNLIISPKADSDLKDIQLFIQQENPMAAVRVTEAILQQLENLRLFPYVGTSVKGLNNFRKLAIKGFPYYVFYSVGQSNIHILRVYHTAREDLF